MRIHSGEAVPAHGGRREEAARRYGIPREELLDFSASINLLGPPPAVAAALRVAATQVAYYPEEDAAGLVRDMAEYLGVLPDEVVPANGSIEAIYWLAATRRPRRVLIVEPTFSEYRRACEAAGARCHSFLLKEEEGFALDPEQIMPEGYDLVFLCNPNNPTGYYVPVEEVVRLWRRCRAAGAALVVDEAFMDFVGEGASILSHGAQDGLFVLRSFTKSHALAGLRLGCLVTGAGAARQLGAAMPPWNVNSFAIAAGQAALADPFYIFDTRTRTAAARSRLFDDLADLPALDPLPSEANFLLCQVQGVGAAELAGRVGRIGILVRDCRSFAGLGDRFIRVAVRSQRDNSQLVFGLGKALG